jgi:hypothetical protein
MSGAEAVLLALQRACQGRKEVIVKLWRSQLIASCGLRAHNYGV